MFEVTNKNTHLNDSYIRLVLDNYVTYNDGDYNKIYFCNRYPFSDYQKGDYLEIDLDTTRYKSSEHDFDDTRAVRKVSYSLIKFQKGYTELQVEKRNLESKNSDLHREIQNLISAGEKQLATKDEQIKQANNQLVRVQNDRDDYKNKWVISENEVKRITNSFNALQLENNRKDEEIKKQKDKIKELKGELNISKEEVINHELDAKEERLEIFSHQLGVNWNQVRDLRNTCKQLIRVQESDYNQNNLDTAKENKENAKQAITEISIENRRKLCRKCEKLAKLEIEHEKILKQQSQYQAHQEQPTNK